MHYENLLYTEFLKHTILLSIITHVINLGIQQRSKSRKRIETLFSQLCDQFMIRRNYAKSFDGFKTRIMSKISALTVIQYINKFTFGRTINNLKVNIL